MPPSPTSNETPEDLALLVPAAVDDPFPPERPLDEIVSELAGKKLVDETVDTIYALATRLWMLVVNTPGGHPGVPGPSGNPHETWTPAVGHAEGAIIALEHIAWKLRQRELDSRRSRPECPNCHQTDRVEASPQRHRGLFFCPCNEPGEPYFS